MDQSLYHQSLTIHTKTSLEQRRKLQVELQMLTTVTRTINVIVTNAGGEIKHEIETDMSSLHRLLLTKYLVAEDVLLIGVFGDTFDLDEVYLQVDEDGQHLPMHDGCPDSPHCPTCPKLRANKRHLPVWENKATNLLITVEALRANPAYARARQKHEQELAHAEKVIKTIKEEGFWDGRIHNSKTNQS
jgi:hypothetical protein